MIGQKQVKEIAVDSVLSGAAASVILRMIGPVGTVTQPRDIQQVVALGLLVGASTAVGEIVEGYLTESGWL